MSKKTLNFGKVAYNGNRKINSVNVTVELEDTEKGPKLAICGEIWNAPHTDCVSCGQNIDTIKELLPHNKKVARIHDVWEAYHLNDMQAGTPAQEAAVEQWEANGNRYDYSLACAYLKDKGLYEDNGYKYGSQWLYKPIPAEVINEINSW